MNLNKLKTLSMQQAREIGGKTFWEWCDLVLWPKIKHTARGIQIVYSSQRVKEFLLSNNK